jgi:hypothetical protein
MRRERGRRWQVEMEVRSAESVEKARWADAQRALRMVEEVQQEVMRVRARLAVAERALWELRMDVRGMWGKGRGSR